MTASVKPRIIAGDPPSVKGKSGDHPAVIAFRRKMDSVTEGTLPAVEALNAKLDRMYEKARASSAEDDRREPEDDERRESVIPIDVVVLKP